MKLDGGINANKMKTQLSVIFVIFWATAIQSQITIKGTVYDEFSGAPIPYVNIQIVDKNLGAATDSNGDFTIELSENDILIFIHIGYKELRLSRKEIDNIENVNVFLKSSAEEIENVTIKDFSKGSNILKDVDYRLIDFLVLETGILTIESRSNFKPRRLSLHNHEGTKIFSDPFDEDKKINKIYRSCKDQIYVLSDKRGFIIDIEEDTFLTATSCARDTFDKFINPCKAQIDEVLFYHFFDNNGITSLFKSIDTQSKKIELLEQIEDVDHVQNYLNDLHVIRFSEDSNTTTITSSDQLKKARSLEFKGDFFKTVLYKPLRPNFMVGDGKHIYIFDHLNYRLKTFYNGSEITDSKIEYVEKHAWEETIHNDPITSKIYGLFNNDGKYILREINKQNASTTFICTLECPQSELNSIQIFDDYVYYFYLVNNKRTIRRHQIN